MQGTGRTFMEKTTFENLAPSDQMRGLPQPPLGLPCPPGAGAIPLPRPEEIRVPGTDLRTAIERRESVRQYLDRPLGLDELAFLLWCVQGVRHREGDIFTFRNVPSAGARHALETYVLANAVAGLPPGLYRYDALSHRLCEIDRSAGIADRIAAACVNQRFLVNNAASFVWTAVAARMTWRYGERGYRYLHLDAGHACQNLYLAAVAVGCGVCAVGAFSDEALNAALGVDGETEFALYCAAVGKIR
ncbi:MAG: SagB/ThcOx family dehydrogenase [Methanomicrobiales archaeon]|nr:SagB/ThcOx family dehydrogenase [Methanomicrobiales archaeon]